MLSMPANIPARIFIWSIGVSFVLFQFFLQLSSGVVIGAIMDQQHLTALTTGWLSAAFYIVYTVMQIPVGLFFDNKNSRYLLAQNALICSTGCLVFAASNNLWLLFIGRMLIGYGASFAFVGLSHLLRLHFPNKQFGFMIGLSETLGFIATAIGIMSMGSLIGKIGWQYFIVSAGIIGYFIAFACWKGLPNDKTWVYTRSYYRQIIGILREIKIWINGLFVGLCFAVVTVFGALWAVPFLQSKLLCDLNQASMLTAIFFIGTALSCPLFGYLDTEFASRKLLILFSCLVTALLLLILLYWPTHNSLYIGLLLFSIGLSCGAYLLAYTIANELAHPSSRSTCAGFTNTLALITTPILQPLIGYWLDCLSPTSHYRLIDYQYALLVIPGCLIIAAGLVFFLPSGNPNKN